MPHDRAQYLAWERQKRCPLCRGKRKAVVGVLCRLCSAKHNASQNARYAERRKANVCDWCLGPSDGGAYCAKCRDRRNSTRKPYTKAQRRRWRVNAERRRS